MGVKISERILGAPFSGFCLGIGSTATTVVSALMRCNPYGSNRWRFGPTSESYLMFEVSSSVMRIAPQVVDRQQVFVTTVETDGYPFVNVATGAPLIAGTSLGRMWFEIWIADGDTDHTTVSAVESHGSRVGTGYSWGCRVPVGTSLHGSGSIYVIAKWTEQVWDWSGETAPAQYLALGQVNLAVERKSDG